MKRVPDWFLPIIALLFVVLVVAWGTNKRIDANTEYTHMVSILTLNNKLLMWELMDAIDRNQGYPGPLRTADSAYINMKHYVDSCWKKLDKETR